jgi:hypothetical protein
LFRSRISLEVNDMSGVLHHRFRQHDEMAARAFYRLLFNSGFLVLALLVLLLVSMIFLSRPAW